MKRDMELVRKILMSLEDPSSVTLGEFNNATLSYHRLLILQAGLARGFDATTLDGPADAVLDSLSWAGHDFLDAARNETVWKKTMNKIKETGVGATIEIAKALTKKYTMELLGLSESE